MRLLMEKANTPDFWESIRRDPARAFLVESAKEIYEQSRWEVIPVLRYRDRMRFYEDGDRSAFEGPYFRRRRLMGSAALLALVYPEEPRYLADLQEILWAICDEYSWVVAAHTQGDLHSDLTFVDLACAQTGFTMAEICTFLRDRLDERVRIRAEETVRTRLIQNYVNGSFWWDEGTNNWTAVCACNAGGAMMYLEPELFRQNLPRFLRSMECYIAGFADDGTCVEGATYWHYGFSCFVWFADLLSQFTDGEVKLLQGEKITRIAGFMERSFLKGGASISFSDGSPSCKADMAMVSYLSRAFPDRIHLLPRKYMEAYKGDMIWTQYLRNLCYADLETETPEELKVNVDLPDAQQAIRTRDRYALAVKGGSNGESHNHNDIGHFIFATDQGQIFCDLGAGNYTRQYFDDRTRYDIFCNSSLGHSVPIVDGQPQKFGPEFYGNLTAEGSRIRVSMAGAYGLPELQELTREILCREEGITLTDTFRGCRQVTERLITVREPEIREGEIRVGNVCVRYDPTVCTFCLHREPYEAPHFPSGGVNCLDFELQEGVEKIQFEITVKEGD